MALSSREPYSYSAQPRAVVGSGAKAKFRETDEAAAKRPVNIMSDPRVFRGSVLVQKKQPAAEAEAQKTEPKRPKRSIMQPKKPSTPEAVPGREHIDIQTDVYLEEITDRVAESTIETQTDSFIGRPPTPKYVPVKMGTDAETQVEKGECFDFDTEIVPILDVLIGKTLENGLMEVLEEEELAALKRRQEEYRQVRDAELADVRRLEDQERRKYEEKLRRIEQEKERVRREAEVAAKVAARGYSRQFLNSVMSGVFTNLERSGFFYDVVERTVQTDYMPDLMRKVSARLAREEMCRNLARQVLTRALGLRESLLTSAVASDGKDRQWLMQ